MQENKSGEPVDFLNQLMAVLGNGAKKRFWKNKAVQSSSPASPGDAEAC